MAARLDVNTTLLRSPFAFSGLGKEVVVEFAGYKEGTHHGRPARLILLKVSNHGTNSNSIVDGYEFEIRAVPTEPPPQPQHRVEYIPNPSAIVLGGPCAIPLHIAVPRVDSGNDTKKPPLLVAWAPSHLETTMFESEHERKRGTSLDIGLNLGPGFPEPGAHVHGHNKVKWRSDQNYTITSTQVDKGVRFYIRGPGRKGSGLPPVIYVGVIIRMTSPATLEVYPTTRTFGEYSIIRKRLDVPTTPVHFDGYLQTCGRTDGSCNPASCREFDSSHTTPAVWRKLLECQDKKFSTGVRSGSCCR